METPVVLTLITLSGLSVKESDDLDTFLKISRPRDNFSNYFGPTRSANEECMFRNNTELQRGKKLHNNE